jgi:hypothetical protein
MKYISELAQLEATPFSLVDVAAAIRVVLLLYSDFHN